MIQDGWACHGGAGNAKTELKYHEYPGQPYDRQ